MTNLKEKERILFLQKEIIKHDKLYEMNKPIITDSEYDDLYFELLELEAKYPETRKDSPTQKVLTVFVDALKKVKHTSPILSLKKAKTFEAVTEFIDTIKGIVLLQEKLDGLTLVLTYENGYLIEAVTRGDGDIGEDVLHTVKAIKNIPKRIKHKKRVKLRSECIMPYEAFEKANINGEYASPRNLASGSVRQLNAEITANRDLEVIITEIIEIEGKEFTSDKARLDYIQSLGFDIVQTFMYDTETEEGRKALFEKITNYETIIRPTLRYMIDGLVLKSDSLDVRIYQGFTNKYPKWAISFKFKSQDAITVLKDIIVQVGKMGTLTPVAIFDPILVGDARISRATLHNFVLLDSRDIRIGDTILVERANDVIPKVIKAFHEKRVSPLEKFPTPTHCPTCQHPVEFVDENTSLICTNYHCDSKKLGKLQHFVSRNAMNIDGLGDKTVETLYKEGIISSIKDFYSIEQYKDKIIALDGLGETSYDKMLKGIEKSKEIPFDQVLYALAIPLVGESASKDIVKHFESLENILKSYEDDSIRDELLSIEGVGDKIANSLIDYIDKDAEMLEFIQSIGLQTVKEKTQAAYDLNGITICLTGSFEKKDRKVWKKEFESYGAKVSGSVSKNTDYLVMGDGTEGKAKHLKAIELNVTIVLEDEIESKVLIK